MSDVPPRIHLSTPHMSGREQAYVADAFASNWIAPLGPHVDAFEAEFARAVGSRHAAALSSGTAALHLALQLAGVRPGDEVLVSSLTFSASVNPIAYLGARPAFIDSEVRSWNMDPALLEQALEDRARAGRLPAAVVVVHLYGKCADEPRVEALARQHHLKLVEDASQAHGARIGTRRAGSLGDAAAFSFYPTKNLGAMGDGGAVVCADEDIADTIRSLRHHGAAPDDANRHLRPGATSRLDNLQAALLRIKLPHLEHWTEERRAAAASYREALAGLPLRLPPEDAEAMRQVFHLFVVEVDDRDRVLDDLRAEGIGAAIHYPTPAHLQPAWKWLGYSERDFPAAERLARSALSLPLFPGMREDELVRVAGALARALA